MVSVSVRMDNLFWFRFRLTHSTKKSKLTFDCRRLSSAVRLLAPTTSSPSSHSAHSINRIIGVNKSKIIWCLSFAKSTFRRLCSLCWCGLRSVWANVCVCLVSVIKTHLTEMPLPIIWTFRYIEVHFTFVVLVWIAFLFVSDFALFAFYEFPLLFSCSAGVSAAAVAATIFCMCVRCARVQVWLVSMATDVV